MINKFVSNPTTYRAQIKKWKICKSLTEGMSLEDKLEEETVNMMKDITDKMRVTILVGNYWYVP